MRRCDWAGNDELMVRYHDTEWGVPKREDRRLFESLVLDGAQAGLSWATILKKRENYRCAFDGFDPEIVAAYDESKVAELLADPGIVRNRQKINAAIGNARALGPVREEFGSFAAYIWGFVGGEPIRNSWNSFDEVPAMTKESEDDEQGPPAPGIQIRRPDDLLRLHAGRGVGERPPGRLLPIRRGVAVVPWERLRYNEFIRLSSSSTGTLIQGPRAEL